MMSVCSERMQHGVALGQLVYIGSWWSPMMEYEMMAADADVLPRGGRC
jgi:hypothetical protein